MKSFMLIGALICLGSVYGCGYSGSNYRAPQNTTSLTGNWQFTYTSSKAGSTPVTVSGTLTQNGGNFSGTMTVSNSCATSGMISGTLSGYTLSGTLSETPTAANTETISITGTVATTYNSASGTYQVTSATGTCAAAMGDRGTWTGTRSSSGGGPYGYGGMLMPADRIPVHVALSLKSDGAQQLSGTATFTNSACLRSMNVTGTQSGANVELKGEGGKDDSVVLTGTMNEEENTLTLHSAVSGACEGESATGTLTKIK